MAEAVASKIIDLVFGRLGRIVDGELRSLKDVGKDLVKLRSTLDAIRNVLEDAETRPVKEKALLRWLKNLKDVAFDIDDVLDEIAAFENMPNPLKRTYTEMVSNYCLSFLDSFKFRREMAKKIKEIQNTLDMISKEKSNFHLREEAASEHSEAEGNRETGSFVDNSEVYGRDEDKKRIIRFLLHKCNEQNLGVISIVGLGGLGKTTLAQLVYNDDEQVAKHFETKKWVYVSEIFEIKKVIASITRSKPSSMDSMEQGEQIKGKRFLLVLDDVWNEDYQGWARLGSLLKNGAKGSKVMVTTRNARVADVMESDESFSLGGLPDDECWKLFGKHAFKSDDDNAKNRTLVAIGKEIVKKCGGLPLAVKALGSILRFKRKESQWREVRDNEIWKLFKDDKNILPALMLSYNHLTPGLKQCFAYCSIFPKGKRIYVPMLVQLWIAEGFAVDSSEGSSYIVQLKSRSLLDGNIREEDEFHRYDNVQMHDMIHNLAQFIAGDECSIVDTTSGNNTSLPPKSRYASLFLGEATPLTTQILNSGQKLRTCRLMPTNESSYIQGNRDSSHPVLETIISNMQLLRALHLPDRPVEELPAAITKLVHLRYLDLSFTRLKSLPKTIGLLHNLQTLNLEYARLKTLPESIGDLVKLLTLNMYACDSLHSLPNTISTLQSLQTLNLSSCSELKELPESIGGLKILVNLDLGGCMSLSSLPDTIDKLERLQYLNLSSAHNLEALPPTIGTLQRLQTLILCCCCNLKELPESIGDLKTLVNLDLSRCKSLYSLPYTIDKLERLQYLNLSFANNLEALLPTIGTLQYLQTLNLSSCSKLKELPESIGGLKILVNLDLGGCQSLSSLPDTIGKLERLQYLNLSFADNLQELPSTIGTLQRLQTLNLSSCGKLKELPESIGRLKNLVNLHLKGCNGFYSLLDNLGCMSNLEVLDMSFLPTLKTLPESLCSLYNLQRLDLDCCVSLTSMPVGIGRLSQLRKLPIYVLGDGEKCASLAELGTLMNLEGHLCIKSLQNVKDAAYASAANLREKQRINALGLEWDFDADWKSTSYEGIDDFENKRKKLIERVADMDGQHVRLLKDVSSNLQPHQKLERLQMKGYIGKRLPGWMMDLSDLVKLELDSFARCYNLEALEKLCCLEVLAIERFPFIECLPRLGQLPRLRTLRLYMLPRVERLGSQLYGGVGAFPALEELELEMMLGLEEWSGNSISDEGDDFLSCLSSLLVRDCPKLRALPPTVFPSVKELRMNVEDGLLLSYLQPGAFPNLDYLEVGNCIDTEDESSMPEALVQRLHSVPYHCKCRRRIQWEHSEEELEKMRLETLERIATEIEKKLVIEPSSSS